MTRIFVLASLLFVFSSSCRNEAIPSEVQEIVETINSEFAPDGRVALFSITPEARAEGLVLTGETSMPEAHDALFAALGKAGYSPVDSIRILPDLAQLDGRSWGIVRLSVCNIRSKPGHSSELSTQATMGTPLRVYKEEGGWYLVQTPDSYFGWLDPGGFMAMDDGEYKKWQAAEKVVFLPDFGFSYESASADANPVSDLVSGNILAVLDTADGWVKVAYPDGREAYIKGVEVQLYTEWLATRVPEAAPLLATARTFLGRPYLWGGTSGKGVDCSGFTKSVYYQHGLMLPRDASQQVHVGYEVEMDTTWKNLLPGDLLFFGRKATAEAPERIVHVAIYQGDGRIIHSAGTVKENSLRPGDPDFNEYRYDTFVRARRMLDQPSENGVIPLTELDAYRPGGG